LISGLYLFGTKKDEDRRIRLEMKTGDKGVEIDANETKRDRNCHGAELGSLGGGGTCHVGR
jgi:hypothetical protein